MKPGSSSKNYYLPPVCSISFKNNYIYHRELACGRPKPKQIPDFSNKITYKPTEYGVHGHTWKKNRRKGYICLGKPM